MAALTRAEAQKGSPPQIVEIARAWDSMLPIRGLFLLLVGLQDLYRNDDILADGECFHFTLNPAHQSTAENPTDYELFSDRFVRIFPGYVLDKRLRIRPGPQTPTVNFAWLKELLLSNDLSRNEELEWIKGGDELRFLQGDDLSGNQVAFQSHPRSGNTFLRRIVETCTGIYSGSDQTIDYTLHLAFYSRLAGENTAPPEDLCWVTKTHWPHQFFGAEKFGAQRCFSIVRNPIDSLVSYSYLYCTTAHTKVPKVPLNELDSDWWRRFIKATSTAQNESIRSMRSQVQPVIPIYFVRYEDLVLNPEPVLRELFAFLLAVETIEGTVIEKRIQDYVAQGSTSAQTYKLKADPKKNLSRNRHMYTDEQITEMKQDCREFLYYFGYASHSDSDKADAATTFFEYEEDEHDD